MGIFRIVQHPARGLGERRQCAPPEAEIFVMSGAHVTLVSRCAANIMPKPVERLWPGRVAIGKQTLIALPRIKAIDYPPWRLIWSIVGSGWNFRNGHVLAA